MRVSPAADQPKASSSINLDISTPQHRQNSICIELKQREEVEAEDNQTSLNTAQVLSQLLIDVTFFSINVVPH